MASSGIKVSPEAHKLFSEIKQRKKKHKYVLFKISDDLTKVETEYVADEIKTTTAEEDEQQWEEMLTHLTLEEPRFILYDFSFERPGRGFCQKLALIKWCDDNCNVKKRMKYSSTTDTVKKAFDGIAYFAQVNDKSDLAYAQHHIAVEKH